jgi:spermidine synthase
LGFEYLQVMAAVIASHRRPPPAPLTVLHLGAGGCALAWALQLQRPGSRQLAVEIDAALVALVREWFDLPRAPLLRLRVGEAAAVVAGRAPGSADVVVRDVFSVDTTPQGVRSQRFTRDVARLLRPEGMYLANVATPPGLDLLKDEIVTVASVFEHVAVIAETSVLRGRRYGNTVVVAGSRPLHPQVGRDVLRTGLALRVVHGPRLVQLAQGGRVLGRQQDPDPAGTAAQAVGPAVGEMS